MIHLLTFSEVGGHRVNEDAFVARTHPVDSESILVCLADGQGGRSGGARASQLACETVWNSSCALAPRSLAESATWQAILTEADAVVAADAEAGFTTLIGLCIRDDFLSGASCGDSAVLVLSDDSIEQPTSRQFKNPPVGSGEADFVPFERKLYRPWRVLVVSDGVWKYAGWDMMSKAARESGGNDLISRLQSSARLRASGMFPDDFTVVLLEAPS